MKCTSLCFGDNLLLIAVDGGTAWMARDSMVLEADTVDSSSAAARWWHLAQQLKQDLASIILMSEADLQVPALFLYFTNSVLLSHPSQHALVRKQLSSVVTIRFVIFVLFLIVNKSHGKTHTNNKLIQLTSIICLAKA